MTTPQTMMLGVPAGVEPVSDRSLADAPPVATEPTKPKRKREIRGNILTDVDGEKYRVEMRESGVTVRRPGKHHVDTKPMREVVDFVTGQMRLPLESDGTSFLYGRTKDLVECCIEFIASHMAAQNNPKLAGRYRLAASALREQVDTLAPGKVDEVLKSI